MVGPGHGTSAYLKICDEELFSLLVAAFDTLVRQVAEVPVDVIDLPIDGAAARPGAGDLVRAEDLVADGTLVAGRKGGDDSGLGVEEAAEPAVHMRQLPPLVLPLLTARVTRRVVLQEVRQVRRPRPAQRAQDRVVLQMVLIVSAHVIPSAEVPLVTEDTEVVRLSCRRLGQCC